MHAIIFQLWPCLTLLFWCTQSELEDLCFAVMHPREYRALRSELDTIWGLPPLSPTCISDAADKALTPPATPTEPDQAADSPATPASSSSSGLVCPAAEAALPTSGVQMYASSSGGTKLATPAASSNILSMPAAARRGLLDGSAAVAATAAGVELCGREEADLSALGSAASSTRRPNSGLERVPSSIASGTMALGTTGEPCFRFFCELMTLKAGGCGFCGALCPLGVLWVPFLWRFLNGGWLCRVHGRGGCKDQHCRGTHRWRVL